MNYVRIKIKNLYKTFFMNKTNKFPFIKKIFFLYFVQQINKISNSNTNKTKSKSKKKN